MTNGYNNKRLDKSASVEHVFTIMCTQHAFNPKTC